MTEAETILLETIKCNNGKLYNLDFHQKRFEAARKELNFYKSITLKNEIIVPEECRTGLFRCRVLYASKIEKIEFLSHQIKKVNSLKLVYDEWVDYHLKYSNREHLDSLYNKRENCDDILIVKNNCITDSWTANPVFFDGTTWWTPDTTLLAGTQRAKLLAEKRISVCRITTDDLKKYKFVGLINALQDLEDMPIVRISDIKF